MLEILNDDMPYVVESVISELHAQGLMPRLVFHPIFKVKRYGSGRLQAVVGPGDRHWAGGDQESYIAVLLEPLDAAARPSSSPALDAVLDDVRAAATDHRADARAASPRRSQPMTASSSASTRRRARRRPLEIKEAAELLRWLGQGNFTLLGIRDYELVGIDEKVDLWPAATGALGIARAQRQQCHRRADQARPR